MFGKTAAVFVEETGAAVRSSRGCSMTPCPKEVLSVCTLFSTVTILFQYVQNKHSAEIHRVSTVLDKHVLSHEIMF